MTSIKIGDYVRRINVRHYRPNVSSKTHKVESLVADDVVTACGKRMRDELGGLTVGEVTANNACLSCFRPNA